MTDREGPQTARDLLDRIDESWRDLLQSLDDISDERMEELGVCGDWSIKHVMGHLAFWDDEARNKIHRTLAGLPEDEGDVQSLNEADHAARAARTLAQERSAMHQSHAAVVASLEEVAGIDGRELDEAIRPDTYDHYAEHARDIRDWRTREGV